MRGSPTNLPERINRKEVTRRVCVYVSQNFPEEKIDDFDLNTCVDAIMQGKALVDEQSAEDSFVLINEYFTISIQDVRNMFKAVFTSNNRSILLTIH